MTKRAGRSAANDPGVAGLSRPTPTRSPMWPRSWDYQVRVALECSLGDNLEGITRFGLYAVGKGREAIVDCEHFRRLQANPDYALACAEAA